MAFTIMGSPVDYMNMKQLRFRARQLGLAFDLSTTAAALITAIKAAQAYSLVWGGCSSAQDVLGFAELRSFKEGLDWLVCAEIMRLLLMLANPLLL